MTRTQSQFGSLSDRITDGTAEAPSPPPPTPVRHAWLDGEVPVLLVKWRRTETGSWEGLVIGATTHGPATTWVKSHRLQAADTTPPGSEVGV